MKQAIKKNRKIANKTIVKKRKKIQRDAKGKVIREHPKFGTSKAEQKFATDFLDKLGVKYVWQFEAKEIGRFYDFYLPNDNILLEFDGSYYHSDPRIVDETKMNPMQKKNRRVDEYKNKWALLHGIPLYRIWEKDVNERPELVMQQLKEVLKIQNEANTIKENKNKRHKNKIKNDSERKGKK